MKPSDWWKVNLVRAGVSLVGLLGLLLLVASVSRTSAAAFVFARRPTIPFRRARSRPVSVGPGMIDTITINKRMIQNMSLECKKSSWWQLHFGEKQKSFTFCGSTLLSPYVHSSGWGIWEEQFGANRCYSVHIIFLGKFPVNATSNTPCRNSHWLGGNLSICVFKFIGGKLKISNQLSLIWLFCIIYRI